jgi:hypothetical protein
VVFKRVVYIPPVSREYCALTTWQFGGIQLLQPIPLDDFDLFNQRL